MLFRAYQYTCYFFLFLLLLPVLALYLFDLTLYLCRIVSFCCRWQVYHIKNQSGTSISFISERRTAPQPLERRSSSSSSILSERSLSDCSLSDTPCSSNYCLTSSPVRKSFSHRRSTITCGADQLRYAPLIPDHIAALADPEPTLRRTRSSDLVLSLDRYDMRATK